MKKKQDNEEKIYRYDNLYQSASLIWAFIALLFFIIFQLYVFFKIQNPNYFGLAGILAILMPLWFLAGVNHVKRKKYLQPIAACEEVIKGYLRHLEYTILAKGQKGELKWKEIEQFQFFRYPDKDSIELEKKSGFRLIAGDRKIVIYENIKEYEELLAVIKSKIDTSKIVQQKGDGGLILNHLNS